MDVRSIYHIFHLFPAFRFPWPKPLTTLFHFSWFMYHLSMYVGISRITSLVQLLHCCLRLFKGVTYLLFFFSIKFIICFGNLSSIILLNYQCHLNLLFLVLQSKFLIPNLFLIASLLTCMSFSFLYHAPFKRHFCYRHSILYLLSFPPQVFPTYVSMGSIFDL